MEWSNHPARPPHVEAPMKRVDQEPILVNKRAEIARAYYPSGVLKAERYRIHEKNVTLRSVDEPRGLGWFLCTWLKSSLTVLVVSLLVAAGAVLWEPWGAVVAAAGIGFLITLHWD